MVKKGKTRATITLNEKLLQLIKLRGNISDYISKCIKLYIGQIDMPNYYEVSQIGLDPSNNDIWKELGWYEEK